MGCIWAVVQNRVRRKRNFKLRPFISRSDQYFANEQAKHLTCRVYACAKTHVAVAGLHIEGATKCTLAALQRRYVALGAIEVPSVCIVDEISLCTTQDFHTLLELRQLGCALWLIGDPASQLTAIGDHWHSADLTGDISDTAMLRSAVDCQRCVFTEPLRRAFVRMAQQPAAPARGDSAC